LANVPPQHQSSLHRGAHHLAQPLGGFERHEVAAVDGIAVKDARVELGDNRFDAGCIQRDRACSRDEPQPKFLPATITR